MRYSFPQLLIAFTDNVGGSITDLMLNRMAKYGRISCCGAISNYNNSGDATYGIKNWFEIIIMRLQCKGFIVLDYMDKYPEAREVFRKALEDGKLKIDEGEQIVKGGFEDVPKTWLQLFSGGKNQHISLQLRYLLIIPTTSRQHRKTCHGYTVSLCYW